MNLDEKPIFVCFLFIFLIFLSEKLLFDSELSRYGGTSIKINTRHSKYCEHTTRHLKNEIRPNLSEISFDDVLEALSSQRIRKGGSWKPKKCISKNRVAILIPYRDRLEHLKSFLLNMHPIFARQELDYKIYVIEPVVNITFNRGLLFNVGFIESNKEYNWDCHVYHDVDLLSEYDGTLYTCPKQPTHLAHFQSKWNYGPNYPTYFGGATILRTEHYKKANGYSNMYFGWGNEDDDHRERILSRNMTIINPKQLPMGKYFMYKHERIGINPNRRLIFNTSDIEQYEKEGLNSIEYELLETVNTPLYTKFTVYYDQKELLKQLPTKLINRIKRNQTQLVQ